MTDKISSVEIMELHHDKHHATYVAGANAALEALEEERNGEANPDRIRDWRRAPVQGHYSIGNPRGVR